MVGGDDCGAVGGLDDWQGKSHYSEKNLPYYRRFHHEL
jgi:hypothetical protein